MRNKIIFLALLFNLVIYAQSFTIGVLNYSVASVVNSEVEITGYNSVGGGALILSPTVVNNGIEYTVTSIGGYVFSGRLLTSVDIPNTITSVGPGAFQSNNFTSVVIPESITSISLQMFANCNQLTSVEIPEGVTSIGDQAFANCTQLTSVTFAESVTSIGALAFTNSGITDLTLPENLASLSSQAFSNNPLEIVSLLGVVPPTLGDGTFGYGDLSTIDFIVVSEEAKTAYESDPTWSGSVGEVTVDEGAFTSVIFDFGGLSFSTISSSEVKLLGRTSGSLVTDIVIPSIVTYDSIDYTVTSIENRAFNGDGLTSVTIPDSVVDIEEFAFNNNNLTSVVLPSSLDEVKKGVFRRNNLLTVDIPNTVTVIRYLAFIENNLEELDLPDSVTNIEAFAFFNNDLTTVKLPASVSVIGEKVFYNNPISRFVVSSLSTISITSNLLNDVSTVSLFVPTVAAKASYENATVWQDFEGIYVSSEELVVNFDTGGLMYSVHTHDQVEVLGLTNGNTNTDIVIPETVVYGSTTYNVTEIADYAFQDKSLTSVSLPSSITNIGSYAFSENNLQSISIPDSVQGIGVFAFYDNDLTSLTLSNSLEEIGIGTFKRNNLASVSIPNSVELIDSNAFSFNNLEDIVLSNMVTTIGKYAFYDNDLNNVSLPSSITSIGYASFFKNPISEVTVLNENPVSITSVDFANKANADLVVSSEAAKAAYKSASVWQDFKNVYIEVDDLFVTFDYNGLLYSVVSSGEVELLGRSSANESVSIVVPETVLYNGKNYTVTSVGVHAFSFSDIENVSLSSNVEIIGKFAFYANSLTHINLPSSVSSIGYAAFFKNPLSEVTVLNENPVDITLVDFANRASVDLIVPTEIVKETYENALVWQDFREIIVIGGEEENTTITNIDDRIILESDFSFSNYQNEIEVEAETDNKVEQLELYNFKGQLVKISKDSTIDLSDVVSGLYILKVDTSKGSFMKKIFK